MRLKDKVAIVTGASSGFGEGIARTYVREGTRIVVADINEAGGKRVVDKIVAAGGQACFIKADVSRSADMTALLAAALDAYGGLHIVVNNAGTTHRNRPMLEVEEDEFDRLYAINVKSIYLSARTFVPYFRQVGGGAFINIASTAGVRPRPGLTWYNGSQGAVITTSKSMAAELGPDNIRVNCVNPVMSATGLLTEFMGMPDTPENRKKFTTTIPLGRFSTPDDIANAYLYLGSDEVLFITASPGTDVSFEESTYSKVTWRLLPLLFLCYVASYLDRVNVGFAKLQMLQDLKFSETIYVLGAGIFSSAILFLKSPATSSCTRSARGSGLPAS